jgi:hypothetical protein
MKRLEERHAVRKEPQLHPVYYMDERSGPFSRLVHVRGSSYTGACTIGCLLNDSRGLISKHTSYDIHYVI